jgi:hypothetical protein
VIICHRGSVFEIGEAVTLVIIRHRAGLIWQEVKEGKQKIWNSPYKVSGDRSFGTYCLHMAASDFFLLIMWRFGPSFLKKNTILHLPQPPLVKGWNLGFLFGIPFEQS